MLGMAKIAHGRQAYYLATVATGREHSGGLTEPDGAWLGGASAALGLSGPVTRHDLDALLAGADPLTGEIIRPAKVRVAALDCVFSPPKSVSILHALGPAAAAAELQAGHELAVAGAVGYLERAGGRVRRTARSGRHSVPASGLAAAAFLHRTSRAPDPHLHTHVLIANNAPGPDGRWSALDGRALFVHASTAAHLYEAHVRREVAQRLGLRWRPLSGSWSDLEGFDAELLRAFSRRSEAIERRLAELGLEGPHARRIAALATRPPKVLTVPYEELVSAWRERAIGLGVARGRFDRLVTGGAMSEPRGREAGGPLADRRGSPPFPAGDSARLEEDRFVAAALGPQGLTARAASFSRRDLIRARCRELPAGAAVAEIERFADRLLSSRAVVARGPAAESLRGIPAGFSEQRWTTPEILAIERWVVGQVEGGAPVTVICSTGAARYDSLRADLAVAPTRGAARSLEALTGIETVPVAALRARPGHSVIAVVGAERIDPRSLAGVISTADAMRASVVLVAGERTGWRDAAALQGIAAVVGIGTAQPARHPAGRAENALEVAVDEMNVVFVASPAGLRERVMADFDARREQGERAVVVVADRRLAEDLSADLSARRGATAATNAAATTAATTVAVAVATVTAVAVSPSRANDLVRAGAVDRLLMLGDASALSRAARRSTEGRRDHYVVDRFASYGLPSETRTGLALEIALPARIERQLGPRLDDPEARSAWRTAAAAHEGRGLLAEVKLREALRELAHCRGSELTPDALSPHVRAREGRSLPPR